jgi:thiol-disulfide isomerase/thioredoxin
MNLLIAASIACGLTIVAAGSLAAQTGAVSSGATQQSNAKAVPKMTMRIDAGSLLLRDDVAQDLGLTAEQRKLPKPKAIYDTLNQFQRQRLAQIVMQLSGIRVLLEPEVQEKLDISPAQVQKMLDIGEKFRKDLQAINDPDTDAPNPEKWRQLAKATNEAYAAVLTNEQTIKYHKLLGKPFQAKTGGVSIGPAEGKIGEVFEERLRPPMPVPTKALAGSMAPYFTALSPEGKEIKLSDFHGKVVVLDFWATWCGPCLASMPEMQKLREQTQDQGVVFLAVNVWDTQFLFKKFVSANPKYTFTFVVDPAGKDAAKSITQAYDIAAIPTTFVIDKDGKVVFRVIGDEKDAEKGLVDALKGLGVKL